MTAPRRKLAVLALMFATSAAVAQRPGQPGSGGRKDDGSDKKGAPPPLPTRAILGEPAPELVAAEWVNTKGGKLTLERLRNRVVLIYFFRTDDASLEFVDRISEIHSKMGARGVVVLGMTPQKKDAADRLVKEKNVKFAIGTEVETSERYQVSSFPRVYLIDAYGRLANRFHPSDDIEEKVRAVLRLTPPEGADASRIKNRIEHARTAYKNKEVGRAFTIARECERLAEGDAEQTKSVTELVRQIKEGAKRQLDEAKAAAKANEVEKATPLLAELSVRFAGDTIGSEADTQIGRLMDDAKLKPVLRKAIENVKGQMRLEVAADFEAAKRYGTALDLYREVIDSFPDSPAAQAAEEAIERINSNAKIQSAIQAARATEQAERWLDLGDRFARVEMVGPARQYYERVIAEYPDSDAAAKARERIEKLPEAKPEESEEEALAEDVAE